MDIAQQGTLTARGGTPWPGHRRWIAVVLALAAGIVWLGLPGDAPAPARSATGPADLLEKLPLAFVPNRGQFDQRARFVARGAGYTLFLTRQGATLNLRGAKRSAGVRIGLAGASDRTRLVGAQPLPGKVNDIQGSDPSRWKTGIPTFGRVQYRGAWPGIDAVFYGRAGRMEYDFTVAPGVDPGRIGLTVAGASRTHIDRSGALVLETAAGPVRQLAPVSFQRVDGRRVPVASRFRMEDGVVRIAVGRYDRARPLVVDPVLDYTRLFGGALDDQALAVADGGAGRLYVTGYTDSIDFPVMGSAPPPSGDGQNVFVVALDVANGVPVYSTYFGGSGQDYGFGIAARGPDVWVTGTTDSTNFPRTSGASQAGLAGGSDAFLVRLTGSGGVGYGTYLGGPGTDEGRGVAFVSGGPVVTGQTKSSGFPVSSDAEQTSLRGAADAFLTEFAPDGTRQYSSYLGGAASDEGNDVAVGVDGRVYVTGTTTSFDFPTTPGAFQRTYQAPRSGFVTKFAPSGPVEYSTYLGTPPKEDFGAIAVDGAGAAYVAGVTNTAEFGTAKGNDDAYVVKLAPAGNALTYKTVLGGASADYPGDLAIDSDGAAYVTGYTASADFPTTAGQDVGTMGDYDAFVTRLRPAGDVGYSTHLGAAKSDFGYGITVRTDGRAVVVGATYSPTFPGGNGYRGASDAFVTQLPTKASTSTTLTSSKNPSAPGDQVTYTATVTNAAASGATVTFTDGTTAITGCTAVALVSGKATCTQTYPNAGDHAIAVSYGGDDDRASSGASLTQQVRTPTTTTLASSSNPVAAGSQVTYTATVSPSPPPPPVGGTVAFTDGGVTISGCEAVTVFGGKAACSQTYSASGTHTIKATYSGFGTFAASVSADLNQSVVPATATTVASSKNPVGTGEAVTYTATVAPAPNGGTVAFADGGTTIAGCGAVAVSAGKATCSQTYAASGTHPISAKYSGNASFGGSASGGLAQTVNTTTTTTLASSPNPVVAGSQVTYTATVSPTPNGGTVAFTDGGITIPGCGAVALTAGKAECKASPTTTGAHAIKATYSGFGSFAGSATGPQTQTVIPATTTELTPSKNPAAVKEAVTYTATVSPTPNGGTVAFTAGGNTIGGCGAVAVSAGKATCTQNYQASGSRLIKATYSGNASFGGSSSATLEEVVADPTTTTLTAAPNPSLTGEAVTYTATVSPTPTNGAVTFTDGGTNVPGCAAVDVTAGVAKCVVTYGSAGTHSIKAAYTGGSYRLGSTSATLTQTVNLRPPAMTSPPTIAGTAQAGQTLTESHGTYSGDPTSFTHQWEVCAADGTMCVAIPGATAQTYVVQTADVGHTVRVVEIATNAAGSADPAASLPTVVIAAAPPAGATMPPPVVTVLTGAAAQVTKTAATLGGTIDPAKAAVTWRFEYGPTAAYGQSTPAQSIVAGKSGAQPVGAALAGLTPGTTYHYRLVAAAGAVTTGADRTFTTAPVGRLVFGAKTLKVKKGRLQPSLRCADTDACAQRVSLVVKRRTCSKAKVTIAPGATRKVKLKLSKACARALGRAKGRRLKATLITKPTSPQPALRQKVTLRR